MKYVITSHGQHKRRSTYGLSARAHMQDTHAKREAGATTAVTTATHFRAAGARLHVARTNHLHGHRPAHVHEEQPIGGIARIGGDERDDLAAVGLT